MNERIEELTQQAWRHADLYSRDGDGTHGHLFRDKFAELIVKECATVYRENTKADRPLYPTEFSTALTNHFGIKE